MTAERIRALRRAGKQEVFSRHDEGLDIALGGIVVDVDSAIVEVGEQAIPMFEGVCDGFANGRFGKRMVSMGEQPLVERVQNGTAF